MDERQAYRNQPVHPAYCTCVACEKVRNVYSWAEREGLIPPVKDDLLQKALRCVAWLMGRRPRGGGRNGEL